MIHPAQKPITRERIERRARAKLCAAVEDAPVKSTERLRAEHALNVLALIMAGDNDEDADAVAPIYDRLEIELAEWDDPPQTRSKMALARSGPAPARAKRKPWHWMGEAPAVYFFKSGDFIKIGKSTGWRHRLAAMRTASPHPVIPLLVLHAKRDTEHRLHARFKKHRINGEWFQPAAEIMAYIEERKADGLPLEGI